MARITMNPRFEKFVSPEPNSGCWLWSGARFTDGYGAFRFRGRQQKAHRVSFTLHRGEIPEDMQVCHTCDLKCCVNPEHLFLGSHADNMADRNRKGRQSAGTRQPRAKLTPTLVEAIRDRAART